MSGRTIKSWNHLLEILTDRLRNDRPIRHLYDKHGRLITSLSDLDSAGEYVACHGSFKRGIIYNRDNKGWTNKPPLWGRRGTDYELWRNKTNPGPASQPSTSRSSVKSSPVAKHSHPVNEFPIPYKDLIQCSRIFINSKNSNQKIKLTLNPNVRQDISDVITYVCDAMKLRHLSTTYITSKQSNEPITDINQLFDKFNGNEFLILEGSPMTTELYTDVTTCKHSRDVYTMTSPESSSKDVTEVDSTNIRLEWVYG